MVRAPGAPYGRIFGARRNGDLREIGFGFEFRTRVLPHRLDSRLTSEGIMERKLGLVLNSRLGAALPDLDKASLVHEGFGFEFRTRGLPLSAGCRSMGNLGAEIGFGFEFQLWHSASSERRIPTRDP